LTPAVSRMNEVMARTSASRVTRPG
jgi:hypothetical protein